VASCLLICTIVSSTSGLSSLAADVHCYRGLVIFLNITQFAWCNRLVVVATMGAYIQHKPRISAMAVSAAVVTTDNWPDTRLFVGYFLVGARMLSNCVCIHRVNTSG